MGVLRIALVVGALMAGVPLARGQSLPALLPTTLPAATATVPAATMPVADLSTPTKALRSFLRAYRAGDGAAIQKCVHFKDAKDAEVFAVSLDPQLAQMKLGLAAEAKFGRDPMDRFHIQKAQKDLDELIRVSGTFAVQIKDGAATIAPKEAAASEPASTGPAAAPASTQAAATAAGTEPAGGEGGLGDDFGPVHLEKVGVEWKLQGSDFQHKVEPAELKSMEAFSSASVKLCRELTGQIHAGTIKSHEEVADKLEKGMAEIVGKALDPEAGVVEPATGPASGPASAPATAPGGAAGKIELDLVAPSRSRL